MPEPFPGKANQTTLSNNVTKPWIECRELLSNSMVWLPTARMLFGSGEPKRVRAGRKGGRGVQSEGYEFWVSFDRVYVVSWIVQKLLRGLAGITREQFNELINEAWREAGYGDN